MRRLAYIYAALSLLLPITVLHADTESSAHYTIEEGTLSGDGSTDSSSASYSAQNSLGEPSTGPSTGGSYGADAGYARGGSGVNSSGNSSASPSNSGATSASGGGNGAVIGCSDPSALNFSAQAFAGNDAGCQYEAIKLQTQVSAPVSISSSSTQTASAASALGRSGNSASSAPAPQAAVSSIHLSLRSAAIVPGGIVSAAVSFPGIAPGFVVFSIVNSNGSVATSSEVIVGSGESSAAQEFSSAGLQPGSYTLHARIAYADGTGQDLNETFEIAGVAPTNGLSGDIAGVALACLFFGGLYYALRRRK